MRRGCRIEAVLRVFAPLLALTAPLLVSTPLGAQTPANPATPVPPESAPGAAPTMSPSARFARGVAFYDSGQFPECVTAFEDLLTDHAMSELGARQIERARVYLGACLIASGQPERADAQFREAISQNPQMVVPSAVVFPQAVVDRFILVRSALLDEIRRAQLDDARKAAEAAERARSRAAAEQRRIAELERLARQERVVNRSERWMAWVPFGVGQFQNRDYVLGGVLLAVEATLLATGITATAIELSLHSQAGQRDTGGKLIGVNDPEGVAQLNQSIRAARIVSLAALGGFALTAIAGIAEANLSFVPEFDEGMRPRPLGKKRVAVDVSAAPALVPVDAGLGFGVSGSF